MIVSPLLERGTLTPLLREGFCLGFSLRLRVGIQHDYGVHRSVRNSKTQLCCLGVEIAGGEREQDIAEIS
jgi:hypothetical protein